MAAEAVTSEKSADVSTQHLFSKWQECTMTYDIHRSGLGYLWWAKRARTQGHEPGTYSPRDQGARCMCAQGHKPGSYSPRDQGARCMCAQGGSLPSGGAGGQGVNAHPVQACATQTVQGPAGSHFSLQCLCARACACVCVRLLHCPFLPCEV